MAEGSFKSGAQAGQKIMRATGIDKSSEGTVKANINAGLGGSPTNLSHSLSGASAVQGRDKGRTTKIDLNKGPAY